VQERSPLARGILAMHGLQARQQGGNEMFCRGCIRLTVAVGVVLAIGAVARAQQPAKAKKHAAKPAANAAPQGDVEGQFKVFCEEWMGKLAARERDNINNIQWETRADGVTGAYTAYSQEHTCVMKDGTGSVPVGKISYREYRYEKRGGSIPEAKASPPHPVETTEVTEIFRYSAGQWIY
jgi:hypothetical protein